MTIDPRSMDALLDDLALLADGDTDARARHAETLAASDEARDLVFDAERLVARVGDAGDDHVPAEDLEARVRALVAGRAGVTPAATSPVVDRKPRSIPDPRRTIDREVSAPSAQAPQRTWPLLVGILGVAAAAGVLLVGGVAYMHHARTQSTQNVEAPHGAAWTARLAQVTPAGDATGLTMRTGAGAFVPVAQTTSFVPGTTLRTDERTRARLTLDDGTVVVLDSDTEATFDAVAPRTLRIERGQVWSQVTHVEGTNAHIRTARSDVEVVGTELVVTATDTHDVVRVVEGTVEVTARGAKTRVATGQEASFDDRGVEITPLASLASALRFAELDATSDEDVPTPGLGELRARRPGEREERERPLTLAEHHVRVRIVGSVARTEIEETFRNEDDVTLEGVYRFPLPPHARIASLALEVDGKWEEGAFVEKARGAAIFRGVIRNATQREDRQQNEEFVWVPGPWRDPALLEWQRGGRFELRIFPIAAHSVRRVRITYEEHVPTEGSGRVYTYPMPSVRRGEARAERFTADVRISGADTGHGVEASGYAMTRVVNGDATNLTLDAAGFAPSGDLSVHYVLPGRAELRAATFAGAVTTGPEVSVRSSEVDRARATIAADDRGYVVFTLRPEIPGVTTTTPTDYTIVVDSSQSMRGHRYERATRLVREVVGSLDRRHRVTVLRCDLDCASLGALRAPSAALANEAVALLEHTVPAGSSNIVKALRTAIDGFGTDNRPRAIIYVGDGQSTSGPTRIASIAAELEALTSRGVHVSTVGVGQDADTRVLGTIARIGGGQFVPFVPGETVRLAALRVLETTYGSGLVDPVLELPSGLEAVAPSALPNLRAGQEIVVTARMRGPVTGEARLSGKVAGRPFERRYPLNLTASTSAGNAFVPRVWAENRIADLDESDAPSAQSEKVALSVAFGVMTRETSLIVLESEAMFRAFGVERSAPVATWTGEEAVDETNIDSSSPADALGDRGGASDLGSLGYSGSGAGGAGRGSLGIGAPRRSAARAEMDDSAFESSAAPAAPRERGPMPTTTTTAPASRPMPTMPPNNGRWMRREWYREAQVRTDRGVSPADIAAVATAESALAQNPDSRDRLKALVQALLRAGRVEDAGRRVEAWLERDPNDVDALIAASDAAARSGKRDDALRLMSGIVDAEPGNAASRERVALAFERVGRMADACAERIAMSELAGADETSVARARACAGGSGYGAALRTMRDVTGVTLTPADEAARGELVIEATWSGNVDLDISVLAPDGTRLSALGGRAGARAQNATSRSTETFALRSARSGGYIIEVHSATGALAHPVSGTLRVRALGTTRSMPFVVSGPAVAAGRIDVVRRSRLVPM